MPHAVRMLALLIGITCMAGAGAQSRAWTPLERIEQSLTSLSPAAVEAWQVRSDSETLTPETATLRLSLPGREELRAGLERIFDHGPDALTWIGRLEDGAGHVLLARRGEWISGVIHVGTEVWEIRPDAEHGEILIRVDPAGFPACGGGIDPVEPSPPASAARTGKPVSAERRQGSTAAGKATTIDLLVVYSEAARNQLGGTRQIEAHAQAAVDNGNLALDQSLTNVTWRIVGVSEIDYEETGSCGQRLGALRDNRQARALRNRTGADMVGMLLADGGGACGCGFVMRNPGPGFAGSAFQVTANGCAVGNLTYAHEHGHNSGLEHDPDNGTSPGNASYPWSFGHYVNREFRTVMSYSSPCSQGCPRSPYFSNPGVDFNGMPTGIEEERHNALSLSLTAPVIADFRIPPSPSLSVEPDQLEPALVMGQIGTRTFSLSNQGTARLDWTITTAPHRKSTAGRQVSAGEPGWLAIEPVSGTTPAGEQETITLHLNADQLEIGEYGGRLDISSNDPERPEVSVPITLQVLDPTIFDDRFEALR